MARFLSGEAPLSLKDGLPMGPFRSFLHSFTLLFVHLCNRSLIHAVGTTATFESCRSSGRKKASRDGSSHHTTRAVELTALRPETRMMLL